MFIAELVLLFLYAHRALSTDPVLLYHGVNDDHRTLDTLVQRLQQDFPNTYVHSIRMFPGLRSIEPLRHQSDELRKYIKEQKISSNITLIGHSQGALTLRYMIQHWDNHNIGTFISIVGPQVGVSRIPPTSTEDYHWLSNATIAGICYNALGQELSVCNMWNDPKRQKSYKKHNKFLSESLCQTGKAGMRLKDVKSCSEQADNLKRLNKMVLLATPDDGTIYPYESALFGYCDADWNIVKRQKQQFYTSLGLEELERRNALVECVEPGVDHHDMVFDEGVYRNCIRPHIS